MMRLFLLIGCLAVAPLRAADDGASWLNRLQHAVRSLGDYEVRFELFAADDYATTGSCRVSGERYVISMPQARVHCDGKARYEVNDRSREVVVDAVDTESRNLLDNPVQAFDFAGEQYDVRIVSEQADRISLRLTPRGKDASSVIELTLDKGSALPVSVIYGAEEMQIVLKIKSFGKNTAPFPEFRKADFADYEWIDFR